MTYKTGFAYLDPEEIIVDNRVREDLQDIDTLIDSFQEKGQLQPIVVDTRGNLVAGGRRLEAFKRWKRIKPADERVVKGIAVNIIDIEDELDAAEAELFENLHRKDFKWYERVISMARIHRMMVDKHGDSWSRRKTATLVGLGRTRVGEIMDLAEAIEVAPDIKKAPDEKAARRLLTKVVEGHLTKKYLQENVPEEIAEHFEDLYEEEPDEQFDVTTPEEERLEDIPTPKDKGASSKKKKIAKLMEHASLTYRVRDCFEGMQAERDRGVSFHFAEVDPPYGIDLKRVKGSKSDHLDAYNEVDLEDYPEFMQRLANDVYATLGDNAWAVFWHGPTHAKLTLDCLRNAGFIVDDIPAIWVKVNSGGQTRDHDFRLARGYEPFFIARKGAPVLHSRGRLNTFLYSPVPHRKKFHPTQRPIELIEELLDVFLKYPRARVLVPFAGSGNTIAACFKKGMIGIGFDLSQEYYDGYMRMMHQMFVVDGEEGENYKEKRHEETLDKDGKPTF